MGRGMEYVCVPLQGARNSKIVYGEVLEGGGKVGGERVNGIAGIWVWGESSGDMETKFVYVEGSWGHDGVGGRTLAGSKRGEMTQSRCWQRGTGTKHTQNFEKRKKMDREREICVQRTPTMMSGENRL